jgi:chromosome segregation ATPase
MADKSKSPKKSTGKKSSPESELAAAQDAIKALRSTVAMLEKNVVKLEKRLEKNVVKLEGRLEKRVSEFRDEAQKLRAAAEKAGKSAVKSAKKAYDSAVGEPEAPEKVEVIPLADVPKAEMTVTQLRAAARAQGVPGYSRMTKAQLIAALK